ncbi:MAG: outer membrane beta-barrel protein [Legionellales bacterium]
MEFRKKTIWIVGIFVAFLFPLHAFAEEGDDYYPFEIEIMGGINHTNSAGGSISFEAGEYDTLHETSDNNDGIWGFGVGYGLPFFDEEDDDGIFRDLLIGLDLLFFNVDREGEVYQGGQPELNNYNYLLELRTSRLMFNTELDFFPEWEWVFPYIQASAGIARVDATYSDTPVPGIGGGAISLPQHTNYNFAYSFGAGLKFLIMEELQLSVSYLYSDLGDVKTSSDSENADLTNPITGELRTSSGLVGLSYLF